MLATQISLHGARSMPTHFPLRMIVLASSLILVPLHLNAQERTQERETKTVEKEKPAEPTPPPPKEEQSVTEHSIKLDGQTIPYKATPQTIQLKNEKEEPQALTYSTT